MPENPTDPIQQLEQFRTGGLAVTPLSPDEVRRRGDRRRTRRRAAVAGGVAALVVAAVVPVAVLRADDSPRPPVHELGTPTPAPQAVITYPGNGVEISDPDDVDRLTGTSRSFRAFVADQVRTLITENQECTGAAVGITVKKYARAGYATGGVNACGGYAALWVDRDGAWGEGQGGQDVWDCDALDYLGVPRSFAGECTDESGAFGITGYGGAEPGMTADQLTALGLEVGTEAPDGGDCTSVSNPAPVLPDGTVGVFDPVDGLVSVNLTSNQKTAERVGLGTSRADVEAAYPAGSADGSGDWVVPREDGTTFLVRFRDGRVQSLTWHLDPKACSVWMP